LARCLPRPSRTPVCLRRRAGRPLPGPTPRPTDTLLGPLPLVQRLDGAAQRRRPTAATGGPQGRHLAVYPRPDLLRPTRAEDRKYLQLWQPPTPTEKGPTLSEAQDRPALLPRLRHGTVDHPLGFAHPVVPLLLHR